MRPRFTIRDLLWLTLVVAVVTAAICWHLRARPHLIIANVRCIPPNPKVGEYIRTIITYRNVGRKAATRDYNVFQSEPIGFGYSGGTASLEPGEEANTEWGGIKFDRAGDYKLIFSVIPYTKHPLDKQEESKEPYTVYLKVKEKDDGEK